MKKDEQGKLSAMQHLLASLQGGKYFSTYFLYIGSKNITNLEGLGKRKKK